MAQCVRYEPNVDIRSMSRKRKCKLYYENMKGKFIVNLGILSIRTLDFSAGRGLSSL